MNKYEKIYQRILRKDITIKKRSLSFTKFSNNNNKLFPNEKENFDDDKKIGNYILGKKLGALVDGLSTNVITVNDKQLVKILAWYDNEYGYTAQMLRTAKVMFK